MVFNEITLKYAVTVSFNAFREYHLFELLAIYDQLVITGWEKYCHKA